jgi:apolipoprotein N-acyltransferase
VSARILLIVLAAVIPASCWSRVTITTGATVTAVPVAAFVLAAIVAVALALLALAVKSVAGFRSSPYPRTALGARP